MKVLSAIIVMIFICFNTNEISAQESLSDSELTSTELEIGLKVKTISPNPIDNIFTVSLINTDLSKTVEIRVLNIIGNLVIEYNVEETSGKTIDFTEMSSGPYILSVYENGRHVDSQRIIKK